MRKRGTNLNSSEANFIFGGPDNEPVYEDLDGRIVPYDRAAAAVDHVTDPGSEVPADQILSERDKAIARIDQAVPDAEAIEAARARLAKKLDEVSDSPTVDQQG
jgi:hypothetical protein